MSKKLFLFYIYSINSLVLKLTEAKYRLEIGEKNSKSRFVETLNIKWCTGFRLLVIQFSNTLSEMENNYVKGIKEMRDVSNNWKYRYLTIFAKITVIKTYMLPKLTHIASVILNLTPQKIEMSAIHKVTPEESPCQRIW